MRKRNIIYVVLVLMLAGILLSSFTQIKATPTARSASGDYSPPVGLDPDPSAITSIRDNDEAPVLKYLNENLGISMNELEVLSADEIVDLYASNAEMLGVEVHEVTTDSKGESTDIIIAGDGVRNPSEEPSIDENGDFLDSDSSTSSGSVDALTSISVLDNETPITRSGFSQSYTHKVYLPIVMKPNPEVQEMISRLEEVKRYSDNLFDANYERGFIKEYPGCPVGIVNYGLSTQNDYRANRLTGHYYNTNGTDLIVGEVTNYIVGYEEEHTLVSFEVGFELPSNEPRLWCSVNYNYDGSIEYSLTHMGWYSDSEEYSQVYLEDTMIWEDAYSVDYGATKTAYVPPGYSLPAHRYTMRHATHLGSTFYNYYKDPWKVWLLNNTISTYGFNTLPDVYAPLFEVGSTAADNYMFTFEAYHDCDLISNGMDSTLEFGYNPHRYGYESKVCVSRLAYITLSRQDYLAPALQALHILNKYDDPDKAYAHPLYPGVTTTPRETARWLESKWNGWGIPAWSKDPAYASEIRTSAFLGLETKLGYKYGDTTSQYYADMTYDVMREIQWGMPPYDKYYGFTQEEGYILRPSQQGAPMISWTAPGPNYLYGLADRSFISEITDFLSMPIEFGGILTSNAETAFSYWAAVRMHLRYKYDVVYP